MLSGKYIRSSIFFSFCAILVGCTPQKSTQKSFTSYDPEKEAILNPYFIDLSEEAPTRFMDVWNRNTIQSLNIQQIDVFTFGGKKPTDTLEKQVFFFKDEGKELDYTDYKFDESPAIWSQGSLNWTNNGKFLDIRFNRHFGINKQTHTTFEKTDNGYIVLKKKTMNRYDTTMIVGALDQPQSVVSKIGKNIYSIDLFLPVGSSTEDIKAAYNKLNYTYDETLFAQRSVVFTEHGRPVNAFLLNDEFRQVSQSKVWEYDQHGSLEFYEEYIGNSVVRTMKWEFGDDLLPKSVTIGRKQYFYAYK